MATQASSLAATEDPIVVESSYSEGRLAWGAQEIKDENIIAVVEDDGSSGGYKILSLNEGQPFELRITPASILPKEFLDPWLFHDLPPHLHDKLFVLVSTKSGTALAVRFFEEVLKHVLQAVGVQGVVLQTESENSVKEFVKKTLLPAANKGEKQTVILLSGDGGIVDSINAIAEEGQRSRSYTSPAISLFPLGTGNALFHSIHKSSPIPSIYIQGLRTLLGGTPKRLPIFQAKFSPGARLLTNEAQNASPLHDNTLLGAVVASYGFHATLVADSDTVEYRKYGDKRFGMVAQDLLAEPHAYRADVIVNGEKRISREEHGYILISLVSNLQETFTISPESSPLDGKLRIVHFGALRGKEIMDIMGGAYDGGKHVQREEVGYEVVEHVRIDFKEDDPKWRRVCIDGSIIVVEESGWVEVGLMEGELLRVVA